MRLDEIDDVQISDDAKGARVKFILAYIADRHGSKTIFAASSAEYHKDILDGLVLRYIGMDIVPKGGGRMLLDEKGRRIFLWGRSNAFGQFDRDTAGSILRLRYPDFRVLMQEPGRAGA